ncbi:MAG: bifunctional phosphopantothenoylcysteine decarboxylase/phosphopantothenate--cysteine ligase CoaBC [Saprospiraceae bacterium]|nr:bifunctional phosphopantothenoylcysteine decarboxylase/phosphopantothenate--cysteine ligase CoaBC [Saprospiraceae bacterium]
MLSLSGKRIVIAISGSIAVYKMAFVVRLLIKKGADVRVIMTPASTRFVSPLTFSTLSKYPVFTEVISEEGWNNHVEMGLWADAMVIAPATAKTLGHLAHGICDTLLAAVYLSAKCPVFIAPAMDLDMWAHPATQRNIQKLIGYGNYIVPVGEGELASGLHGAGRLAEPETILSFLEDFFAVRQLMKGKKVLITAGPTYEPIDPVRFIGNRSSGKMGIALAHACAKRGAEVHLVLGPSSLTIDHPLVQVYRVETAGQMHKEALALYSDCDLGIMAAAVADYRPREVADKKMKKSSDQMEITLVKNPDIAADLGRRKMPHQRLIGFALETDQEQQHARGKLEKKNFDAIVLNSLRDKGAGFQYDTNKITILLAQDNKPRVFELKSKAEVAEDILDITNDWWPNESE